MTKAVMELESEASSAVWRVLYHKECILFPLNLRHVFIFSVDWVMKLFNLKFILPHFLIRIWVSLVPKDPKGMLGE